MQSLNFNACKRYLKRITFMKKKLNFSLANNTKTHFIVEQL